MTSKTPDERPRPADSGGEDEVAADLRGLRRHTLLQHVIDRAAAAALSKERVHRLLDAVVSVASDLSLPDVLRRVTESACDLAGARYGALGVLGDGELVEFTFAGMDDAEIAHIGHPPVGKGLIGELARQHHSMMLRDLREHEAFSGFPENHPEMRSLLGVPIRVRDEAFGILYLTDKIDAEEFTESDRETVGALAAAAGLAIENARLYDQTHRREQWLRATNETTSSLLTRNPDNEALGLLTRRARLASRASMALLATHEDVDGRMVVRAVDGLLAAELRGLTVSAGSSLTGDVYTSGSARTIDNLGFAALHRSPENAAVMPPEVAEFGPAVLVPMAAGQRTIGVLMIAKRQGQHGFDELDVRMAETFANNVALAIEFTRAQEDRQRLALFEERDRIARDLHDLVIQRLFALGLGLQGLHRHTALATAADEVTGYVEQVDLTIREIRKSIFSLQEPAAAIHGLRADLLRGLQECTPALGFEPTLRLEGPLDSTVPDPIRPDLLATMREALSNVARHAQASSVLVTVVVNPASGVLELVVDDNGHGLADEHVRRSGLANMTRRAQRWHGTCRVESTTTTGTTVHWTVPIHHGPIAQAEANT